MENQLPEIKMVPISLLESPNNNPRAISARRFNQLKQSIEDDPKMLQINPVWVNMQDGDMVIISGNMRVQALKELGQTHVPCIVLELDGDTAVRYMLKANTHYGHFDADELANFNIDLEDLDKWGVPKAVLNGFSNDIYGNSSEVTIMGDFLGAMFPDLSTSKSISAINKRELRFTFDNENDFDLVLGVLNSMSETTGKDQIECLVDLCKQKHQNE